MTRFDVHTELDLGGRFPSITSRKWSGITEHVYSRDSGVEISRGRPDEGSKTDPASCKLTLDNRDGRYSPRNPESPLYGQIGRNTPIRVWVGPPSRGTIWYADTSVTGHDAPRVEPSTSDSLLVCAWGDNNGGDYTVPSSMTAGPELDGPVSTTITATETLTSGGETSVRTATHNVTDTYAAASVAVPGAGDAPVIEEELADAATNSEITLTTASSTQAGWWIVVFHHWNFDSQGTMLAQPQGTPGDWYPMGSAGAGSEFWPRMRAWVRRVDTAGEQQVVLTPDPNDTNYDHHGRVFVLSNVPFSSPRFTGEVSSWPPRWDPSGTDVRTPIEASGLLRRLGNLKSPLRSALVRESLRAHEGTPVAYWPMEDGSDASTLGSVRDDVDPMRITRGSPDLSSYDGFAASEALPQMRDSTMEAVPPEYAPEGSTSDTQLRWLMHIPEGGISDATPIIDAVTRGSARRWLVQYYTGSVFSVHVFDSTGAEVYTQQISWSTPLDGTHLRVSLELSQNGSDVDYALATLEVGKNTGSVFRDTITGRDYNRFATVRLNAGQNLAGTALGHVAVYDQITSLFDLGPSLDAWRGEAAGRRIERLCLEAGLTFVPTGDLDATAAMGPQRPQALLDLLRECANADLGILADMRADIGLHYRTNTSLYNQTPVELNYAAGDLNPPLEPTEDDRNLANDITVSRDQGSSARTVRRTGPLSIQAPPEGVGRYDTEVTLNVASDDQLRQQAQWRLHLGTIGALRYPTVTVAIHGRPGLEIPLSGMDPGDRLTVLNPPNWLPPGDIGLLAEGFSETINAFAWTWQANTSPDTSHTVAELDHDTLGRLDTSGSELAAAITASATSMDVEVITGPLWVTDSAEFPLDVEVGGEAIRVTAVSGTASPQTFTVERSINGVNKSHDAGAAVALAQPMILALGQSGAELTDAAPLYP